MRRGSMRSALWVVGCVCAAAAWGQSDLPVNGNIELKLNEPGSRALAMGGASLALTEDFSAAVANPAALTTLDRMGFTGEYRQTEFDDEFAAAGRVSFAAGREDTSGVVDGTSRVQASGLQYFSFVYPFRTFTLGIYRDEPINLTSELRTFGPTVTTDGGLRANTLAAEGRIDIDVVDLGVSAGLELGENFSIGAGVARSSLDLSGSNHRFTEEAQETESDLFSAPREIDVQQIASSDDDIVFHVGLLFHTRRVAVGAAYHQGGEFKVAARNVVGRAFGNAGQLVHFASGSFKVPDRYGLGLAFHVSRPLLVSLQVDRVTYSDLSGKAIDPFGVNPALVRSLKVDDGDEARLGFEWFSKNQRYPLALRAGVWHEDDHGLSFTGDPALLNAGSAFLPPSFLGGQGSTHYTAGVGFNVGQSIQVDAGYDFSSERGDTASMTGIFRLGR